MAIIADEDIITYAIGILKVVVYISLLYVLPRYCNTKSTERVMKLIGTIGSLSFVSFIITTVIRWQLLKMYWIGDTLLYMFSVVIAFYLLSMCLLIWVIYLIYNPNLEKARLYSILLIVYREMGLPIDVIYLIGGFWWLRKMVKSRKER